MQDFFLFGFFFWRERRAQGGGWMFLHRNVTLSSPLWLKRKLQSVNIASYKFIAHTVLEGIKKKKPKQQQA